MGKQWEQCETLFLRASKSLQLITAAMELKTLAPWKKSYDKPRQCIESRDVTLLTKVCMTMVFPAGMDECESWTIKN